MQKKKTNKELIINSDLDLNKETLTFEYTEEKRTAFDFFISITQSNSK
jgi:hypothetical protein